MENENKKTAEAGQQSAYEKAHGLVCRKDLAKNVLKQMEELSDDEFHMVYSLIWKLGAKDLLYNIAKENEARLEKKLAEIEAI